MNISFTCPPVMICGFNRPGCLKQVFEAVREVRPNDLFLVLDAPREGRSDDVVENARCKKVFDAVDWPCDVRKIYAEKNMGCKRRMESGISSMFKEVEFGIILEDDCVPSPDFFAFAAKMDSRFRNDTRIGMVASSAPSAADAGIPDNVDYYFDRFPYIWGWATWRRAWKKYGRVALEWGKINHRDVVRKIFHHWEQRVQMGRHFDEICTTIHEKWDSLWWLSCLYENMLCIHPRMNLMKNVGYVGLHAKMKVAGVHDRPYGEMHFPLKEPVKVEINTATEKLLAMHYAPTYLKRIFRRIKRFVSRGN